MYSRAVSEIFFTAFDLETTGLYPEKDRIIEIGAIKFNLDGDEYRFSGLIDPGISIPEGASRINGISDDMVKGKPSIDEILPGFVDFINDTAVIAHNIGFDAGFVNAEAEKLGIVLKPNPCIDTVILGKIYFSGLYSYSLGKLSKALGINIENAHRAEDDAEACMKIFLKCIEKVPGYPDLSLKDFYRKSGLKMKMLSKNC